MVCHGLSTLLAGDFGPVQHREKIAPLRVVEYRCQLPCQPVLIAVLVTLANAVKGGVLLVDVLFNHGCCSP